MYVYVIMGDNLDYDSGSEWIDSIWLTEEDAVINFFERDLGKNCFIPSFTILKIRVGISPKGVYGSRDYIESMSDPTAWEDITLRIILERKNG